jgi:serine/threonine protein kinase
LLASLNHPNIAAIYSFEHSDEVHFLVLELVEGETLAEKVKRGPLPVEEALELCRQIAEGVERPNAIGLTLVRLLGRKGRRLSVKGLDCFDGTPILDIKGYQPDYRTSEYSLPDWYNKMMDQAGHI